MNLIGLLQGLKELTRVKHIEDFLAHSKHAIKSAVTYHGWIMGDIKVVERER